MAERRAGLLAQVRRRLDSVRIRTTAAAMIVVSIALVTAAVAMVFALRRQLTADVVAATRLRGQLVREDIRNGRVERPIPVGDGEDEFVQVVGQHHSVVASSENLRGQPAVAQLVPGETERIEHLGLEDENNVYLAAALRAKTTRGRPRTVIVGTTLETVEEFSRAVTDLLAPGIPLLLVVVGLVTWRVVGRALAPVDAMRAEVETISNRQLHRRVPNPGGADEIARLAATMNRMLARLEEGQSRQRRFVSDASHELRSPVTTIRQHAEVALSHPEGTRVEELAEVVLEEDERLHRLVEDLLLLTKLDEGTLPRRTESVDLDDLLFEEAARMRATTAVRVDTSGVSAGRVPGDTQQLNKLVRNLADNAVRHASAQVAFSLSNNGEVVILRVDDDGDGIDPSERHRIFERFVRLDEARDRDSGGSGLGLAIVREIALTHGASVSVRDGPLGGARLEVRFPSAS